MSPRLIRLYMATQKPAKFVLGVSQQNAIPTQYH